MPWAGVYAGAVQTTPPPLEPRAPERAQPGLLVLIAGLGGTLVALFGLPLQATATSFGDGYYFGDIRRYSHPALLAKIIMSPDAIAWWTYLGYLLAGLLVLLVAVTAAVPAVRRSVAQVAAALGVATAAIYTIALIQTSHLAQVVETGQRTGTSFDAARYGVWAAYAGLVVLVAGAILVVATTPLSPVPAVAAAEPDRTDAAAEPDRTDRATEPDSADRVVGPDDAGRAAEPDDAGGAPEAAEPDGAAGPDGTNRAAGPDSAADRAAGPDSAADRAADREGADPATGAR